MVPRPAAPHAGSSCGGGGRRIRRIFPGRYTRPFFKLTHGEAGQPGVSPLGPDDSFSLDEKMANPATSVARETDAGTNWRIYLAVLAVASAVYLGCMVSPPSLMDDVDAVQAQIARNMLT